MSLRQAPWRLQAPRMAVSQRPLLGLVEGPSQPSARPPCARVPVSLAQHMRCVWSGSWRLCGTTGRTPPAWSVALVMVPRQR